MPPSKRGTSKQHCGNKGSTQPICLSSHAHSGALHRARSAVPLSQRIFVLTRGGRGACMAACNKVMLCPAVPRGDEAAMWNPERIVDTTHIARSSLGPAQQIRNGAMVQSGRSAGGIRDEAAILVVAVRGTWHMAAAVSKTGGRGPRGGNDAPRMDVERDTHRPHPLLRRKLPPPRQRGTAVRARRACKVRLTGPEVQLPCKLKELWCTSSAPLGINKAKYHVDRVAANASFAAGGRPMDWRTVL